MFTRPRLPILRGEMAHRSRLPSRKACVRVVSWPGRAGLLLFLLLSSCAQPLAGLHFPMSAAVGLIAVAGISVQNGVIMVEQIVEAARGGLTAWDSAVEGAVARLRPILMTALMAGRGLPPAAMSHGIGSETRRPFAIVVVGGIVSATVFTLLLPPLAWPRFAARGAAPVPIRPRACAAGEVTS